jgi:hypothetical protein
MLWRDIREKTKKNPQITQRSRFTIFPSLRGEMDWWKYRSRSPLSFPQKICKNHERNEGGRASYSKSTMEKREAQFMAGLRRKKGYLYPLKKCDCCSPKGRIIRVK